VTVDSTPAEGVTRVPLKGIRRVAARRMVTAWQAPVFHLTVEVDMSGVLDVGTRAPGSTVTDALLLATARALVAAPGLNAHYADEVVELNRAVNLGVAVATDAGLMVPVIHGVEELSLAEVAERRRDVVGRARSGGLSMKDVEGATFTVSNLGMLGIDRFDAILNPPQVGILAVGSTKPRPVVVGDTVQVRPIAEMTLTCDHRAVDGAAGARVLSALRAEVQSGDLESPPVDRAERG
jgi:pyruvate dehydrogenase E2 component (dihydrolipoamide acetyltransferase)